MTPTGWTDIHIDVSGEWGSSSDADVRTVVASARQCALYSLSIDATNVPSRIRVEGRPDRQCPMVWARDQPDRSATILLTTRDNAWSQLAYQFGHELGHVLCNSWTASASVPSGPSHWLEEALVEAFAIHTLTAMAVGWQVDPPYATWRSYGASLRRYRDDLAARYEARATETGFDNDPSDWLDRHSAELSAAVTLTDDVHAAIPLIVAVMQTDPSAIGDLRALNRWPERGALPFAEYLCAWRRSCSEIGSSGCIPNVIASRFGMGEGGGDGKA